MTSISCTFGRGPSFRLRARYRLVFGGALASMSVSAWAQAANAPDPASVAEGTELPTIVVVGTTPLVGVGTPLEKVPANIQTIKGSEIQAQHTSTTSTLTDYMQKNVTSVDVNDAQGNPSQMDILYRGFTASPLLGTPQGLSVFLDGVRVNEPFGDVVNWDLIPQAAMQTMQIIPGSNPTYGLNTLGGAVAVTTKNGRSNPGGNIDLSGGSWGRKAAQIEQGGAISDHIDYYFTANITNDNGWAEHNASRLRQAFGKLRYTDADTTVSLSIGGADNTLNGSQTIPRSFLDNFRQAYTFPDTNENQVGYLTINAEHYFSANLEVSGNVYYRHYRNKNISSNVNDDYDPGTGGGDIDLVQATNQQSVILTDSYGASLQLTLLNKLFGKDNQLILGAAGDFANTHFTQATQPAEFTDTRATIGIGPYAADTNARTRNENWGVYFENTFSFTEQWSMTLAGRYNWSKATIGDESGAQPLLDGNHTFSRFNPAIGFNWNPTPWLTAYATYNEGMRSPTAIELACADPNAPCSLPNEFLADPDLKPVISRTFEVGARGHIGNATSWSAAVYSTTLSDDIQFVSSQGASSTLGYFQNVGKTRRQGFELAGKSQWGPVSVTASYSYVNATYRSTWIENSASNSKADGDGNITVHSGDRIPGIPANTVKLRVDYQPISRWNIGTNLTYRGDVFARGDENNQDVNGSVAGYVLIDLDTSYNVTKQLQVYATVKNLLNKRYANFAILGQNAFNGPNHTFSGPDTTNEQFLGLGAPRGVWVGLRYAWK
ncbi:TonB-dependent receptor [Caballeronia sp. LZ062]|uniref:TonB-dependent receptor n=1 Tax=unclassified Caballeronia TaxID=2646786 RepID=UPI002858EF6C|nr:MULTISPECIES: TonB-dependent receptor [unclassified Caballeronia]MDR5856011.1 TonB-dependent receptor [Caballeronia sp. LZ050]MDR5872681.1 TonB-dependent receptor [Caballeronia sp. LZ062]